MYRVTICILLIQNSITFSPETPDHDGVLRISHTMMLVTFYTCHDT